MKYTAFLLRLAGFLLFTFYFSTSCRQNIPNEYQIKRVNLPYLDSVMKTADSVYHKNQYTAELASADYYRNEKDSLLMEVMKAKDSSIRQVIITKNNRRIYFAQFYDNGQMKGEYHFDESGANDGSSKEYYRNGQVKEEGDYKNGFRTGGWQQYDSSGKKTEILKYNDNGQAEQTN